MYKSSVIHRLIILAQLDVPFVNERLGGTPEVGLGNDDACLEQVVRRRQRPGDVGDLDGLEVRRTRPGEPAAKREALGRRFGHDGDRHFRLEGIEAGRLSFNRGDLVCHALLVVTRPGYVSPS